MSHAGMVAGLWPLKTERVGGALATGDESCFPAALRDALGGGGGGPVVSLRFTDQLRSGAPPGRGGKW